MKKLRYAVIGTGGMAGGHMLDFTSKPEVELVGLSDPSPTNLQRHAAKYPKAYTHADVETMLRETKPDMVSICTPNKFHCEYTLTALRHGAHVACEKPMAMTLAEAKTMEKARAKAGRIGLVNFSYRNHNPFRFARELVAQGELGNLLRVNVVYLQSWLGAANTGYSWRNDKTLAGFGALGDLGIHMIDAVRFITKLEMTRVIGVAQTLIEKKADSTGKLHKVTTDTNASFLTEFKNGMIGTFETSQAAPGFGNHFRIDISGEKGTFQVFSEEGEIRMNVGSTLTRYATWTTSHPKVSVPSQFAATQPPSTPAVLVNLVRGEKPAYPSFADGVKSQEILEGIFKSMKSGAWVKV